jgi:hypothetical protein
MGHISWAYKVQCCLHNVGSPCAGAADAGGSTTLRHSCKLSLGACHAKLLASQNPQVWLMRLHATWRGIAALYGCQYAARILQMTCF